MKDNEHDSQRRFTELGYWDDYWKGARLPKRVERGHSASLDEILSALTRWVPTAPGSRALEVGGAPGAYLSFLMVDSGVQGSILDYSPIGCAASERNFELQDLEVEVHQGDLFSDDLDIGRYDLVYSLGFIEHFGDLTDVMRRHVQLARPGGIVIVGCPNLRGINQWFLKRLAPELLATHNTDMMDPDTWVGFEQALGLEVLQRGQVGGFEPSVFNKVELDTRAARFWRIVARGLSLLARPGFFKRHNAWWFSHYVMAAYRVPGGDDL